MFNNKRNLTLSNNGYKDKLRFSSNLELEVLLNLVDLPLVQRSQGSTTLKSLANHHTVFSAEMTPTLVGSGT